MAIPNIKRLEAGDVGNGNRDGVGNEEELCIKVSIHPRVIFYVLVRFRFIEKNTDASKLAALL
jgi:hypothetical protein